MVVPARPSRRGLLVAVTCGMVSAGRARAAPDKLARFRQLLGQAASNVALLDSARRYREYEFRQLGPTSAELQARPNLPRRFTSDKPVSNAARDLVVQFEVSNRALYDARYRAPTWPGGRSGVTVGIGYDLGYASRDDLMLDWEGLLPSSAIGRLQDVCGVTGPQAADDVAFVSDIVVEWPVALDQFARFLRYVAGEVTYRFPGAAALSADSFGAMVSLVYNRGSSTRSPVGDPLDRRREMATIQELLRSGKPAGVPDQIRSMKRLWEDDPNARGLLTRRELEAQLFEAGL